MRPTHLALISLLVTTPAWGQTPAAAGGPQWGPPPPFFPAGARFAVMNGDPSKTGEYTVRLSMPAGYTIMPHFHPTDEHITVISGTFLVGMADAVDTTHVMRMAQGDFATAGAHVHHWARAQGRTVVQVHGMGPFAITYLNPSDDPRHTPATR